MADHARQLRPVLHQMRRAAAGLSTDQRRRLVLLRARIQRALAKRP
ncbi:MAG: hypothetical protein ABI838_07050 [Chloroflexota bacterium]